MEKMSGGLFGQCLHAKSLRFKHPVTKEEMFLEAELPAYFKKLLEEGFKERP